MGREGSKRKFGFLPEQLGAQGHHLLKEEMSHHQISIQLGQGVEDCRSPPPSWFSTQDKLVP